MCGITGYVGFNQTNRVQEQVLRSMTAALRHRGPDDLGFWIDADLGVGLGHRRLSIIDLSPAGHQPMRSACGRYVIVFNGEISTSQKSEEIWRDSARRRRGVAIRTRRWFWPR